MMKILIAILLAVGAGTGCSAAINRAAMEAEMQDQAKMFTDDDDVQRIEQLRPQLQFPIRLAVVPPYRGYGGLMEGAGEREELQVWGDKLKKEGFVSEFMVIPEMLLNTSYDGRHAGYLKSIRVAAARMGADAILILRSTSEADRYANLLGVLDLTVVGLFVIPAHHYDALTLVEGLVIDNRNQFLYFAASAEGTATTTGPLATVSRTDALRESRVNALRSFGDVMVREARRARTYVPGPRYETPGK